MALLRVFLVHWGGDTQPAFEFVKPMRLFVDARLSIFLLPIKAIICAFFCAELNLLM